jgi:hypothetical protein
MSQPSEEHHTKAAEHHEHAARHHKAKDGIASRAEITGALMSERAECVMLNKGPHIQQALRVEQAILFWLPPLAPVLA